LPLPLFSIILNMPHYVFDFFNCQRFHILILPNHDKKTTREFSPAF